MMMYDAKGNEIDIVAQKVIETYLSLYQSFFDEKLKICKSVLITVLKTSNFSYTFEVTTSGQYVNINGIILYFTLDKQSGHVVCLNPSAETDDIHITNIIINY